jgi:hypothetical protein
MVGSQRVCLKYRPHGRRNVLVAWHPTAHEAAVAEAYDLAQAPEASEPEA